MAFVIIGNSFSQCSECKGNASWSETSHVSGGPGSGWDSGSSLDSKNGCGVFWDQPAVYVYWPPPVRGKEACWNCNRPLWWRLRSDSGMNGLTDEIICSVCGETQPDEVVENNVNL